VRKHDEDKETKQDKKMVTQKKKNEGQNLKIDRQKERT
jgi:hypothetical protein